MKYSARILQITLSVIMIMAYGNMYAVPAYAKIPEKSQSSGQCWAGVDFDEILDGNIYYGNYDHATSIELSYDNFDAVNNTGSFENYEMTNTATKAGVNTPILWRAMGEEENDGSITMLSEYVLDSVQFDTTVNYGGKGGLYGHASIQTFLNDDFLGSFNGAEINGMSVFDVTTWDYEDGNAIPISADPDVVTDQRVYLPWGTSGSYYLPSVFWSAYAPHDIVPNYYLTYNSSEDMVYSMATTKGGTDPVRWWLRTPGAGYFARGTHKAQFVSDRGISEGGFGVVQGSGYVAWSTCGLRPVFKLDPESVIFAHQIGGTGLGAVNADATNYVADTDGRKNYKLTILNSDITLGQLYYGGKGVTTAATYAAPVTTPLKLTRDNVSDSSVLCYKIVDQNHNTVSYGKGDGSNISIATIDNTGNSLALGEYSVYVWAQEDQEIGSNQASAPLYFKIDLIETALFIEDVSISGNSVIVKATSVEETARGIIFVGMYDEFGRFLGLSASEQIRSGEQVEYIFTDVPSGFLAKAFIWDVFNELRPIALSYPQ